MRKENRIIQGLWIGKSLSLLEQLSIKSFLAHGHEYHLYVYGKVKNIPKGVVVKDANEILPKYKIFKYRWGPEKGGYAGFADLFKLKLLLDKGGIWADLDAVCLRPFDFKKKFVFLSKKTLDEDVKVNVGIMKAPSNNNFIKACYSEARKMSPKTLRYSQNGARLLESNINKFNLNSFVVSPNTFCPIDYWDCKELINPNFNFKIPKETYSIHLWNETWRREIRDKSLRGYTKKFIYRLSAKLKKHLRIYLYFVHLIKKDAPLFLEPSLIEKEKKIFERKKFNKNKIYSPKTLYGRLQRKYL